MLGRLRAGDRAITHPDDRDEDGKRAHGHNILKESLNKSFDKLRTNGKCLIPLVVSLSNHERNQLVQGFPKGEQPRVSAAAPDNRRRQGRYTASTWPVGET
jgi:hypothetical protein